MHGMEGGSRRLGPWVLALVTTLAIEPARAASPAGPAAPAPAATGGSCAAPEGIRLFAAGHRTLAIHRDGSQWVWGDKLPGQEKRNLSEVPMPMRGLTGVATHEGGYEHTLSLRKDGTVWGWGPQAATQTDQFGSISAPARLQPIQVPGLRDIIALSVSDTHALALRRDGSVWAWGMNDDGQLGPMVAESHSQTPVHVAGLTAVTAISAGWGFSVALRKDGSVWAWGFNTEGHLGDGTVNSRAMPAPVRGLDKVSSISAGDNHTLALRKDGSVWAWGADLGELLAKGGRAAVRTPMQVPGLTEVTAIGAGARHSVALRKDGSVWTWGANTSGELGDGTRAERASPARVEGVDAVVSIIVGKSHTLAMTRDHCVWAWGYNAYGQLGEGTLEPRFRPSGPVRMRVFGGEERAHGAP